MYKRDKTRFTVMEYAEFSPPPALARHIRCVWTLTSHAESVVGEPEPIVPDGCAEIVLNLGDPFFHVSGGIAAEQPRALIVGQTTRPTFLRPAGTTRILGIRLWPWGGRPLLGPMSGLRDTFVPLDLLLPELCELHEMLAALPESAWPRATFAYLARHLSLGPVDLRARMIIQLLSDRGGRLTVREMADELHVSTRTVERIVRESVGLSPLVFARILRVQRAIRRLRMAERPVVGRLAVASGYYDQAHFCRELRGFTGLSPSEFVARERGLTTAFLQGDRS